MYHMKNDPPLKSLMELERSNIHIALLLNINCVIVSAF